MITEKQLHAQICHYLDLQYPTVMYNTDLSGIKLSIGQAVQVKKLRSNNGFPDIFIIKKNNIFSGLFLEVKRSENEVWAKNGHWKTPHIREQADILDRLRDEGFSCQFVYSFDMAKIFIDNYMSLK